MPNALQLRAVHWYYNVLCHPVETLTELIVKQHFTWTNMHKDVHKVCSRCNTCLPTKRNNKTNYGLLPKREQSLPHSYQNTQKTKDPKPLQLWAVTMIDPTTRWNENKNITTKRADIVANVLEKTWLTRYPRSSAITLDCGKEFMTEVTKNDQKQLWYKETPDNGQKPPVQFNHGMSSSNNFKHSTNFQSSWHNSGWRRSLEWTFSGNNVRHKINGTHHHSAQTNAFSF